MIITVYGKPKVGKTTFAFSDINPKKVAIIDSDKGLIGVNTEGATIFEPQSVGELTKLITDRDTLAKFDRVIIDTATQLYEDMLSWVSEDKQPSFHMRIATNNLFSQLLRSLRSTTREVVVLCQERIVQPASEWASDDDDEEQAASVTMDIPQGAAKVVSTMSDVIGRLYVARVKDRLARRMWLTPSPNIVAGARSNTYSGKPPYLTRPSMGRLQELLGYKA